MRFKILDIIHSTTLNIYLIPHLFALWCSYLKKHYFNQTTTEARWWIQNVMKVKHSKKRFSTLFFLKWTGMKFNIFLKYVWLCTNITVHNDKHQYLTCIFKETFQYIIWKIPHKLRDYTSAMQNYCEYIIFDH